MLLKVSGAALAEDPVQIETLFPEPSAYVVQFQPGPDDTLIVTFDGDAIEAVLRNAGQTVWGSERPLTLVWLGVDPLLDVRPDNRIRPIECGLSHLIPLPRAQNFARFTPPSGTVTGFGRRLGITHEYLKVTHAR